jgi:short subunit dehydrogenase-like uncharacterized protein
MQFLIYGANGYTGELIAREAARRGLRPVLAGRSAKAIEPLARELGLEARIFGVDAPRLEGVGIVLHCAGPFSRTSAPMVTACLAAKAHYLDITGEIAVFEAVLGRGDEAKRAELSLIPGVGFDVVPTDTVAAMLADSLPGATDLQLAFFSPGATVSRGTLTTMLEGIGEGGAIRRGGRITRVPVAYDAREVPFSFGPRMTMTVPWGDVSTAFHTTGIPNIRVYTGASPRTIRRMRRLRPILPLLGRFPMKQVMAMLARRKQGPDVNARTRGRSYVWGEVTDGTTKKSMTLETPEGYAFTVLSALAAVARMQQGGIPAGAWTPSRAFGTDFVLGIPGVTGDRLPVAGAR